MAAQRAKPGCEPPPPPPPPPHTHTRTRLLARSLRCGRPVTIFCPQKGVLPRDCRSAGPPRSPPTLEQHPRPGSHLLIPVRIPPCCHAAHCSWNAADAVGGCIRIPPVAFRCHADTTPSVQSMRTHCTCMCMCAGAGGGWEADGGVHLHPLVQQRMRVPDTPTGARSPWAAGDDCNGGGGADGDGELAPEGCVRRPPPNCTRHRDVPLATAPSDGTCMPVAAGETARLRLDGWVRGEERGTALAADAGRENWGP